MHHTCQFRAAELAIAAGHPPPVSALVNIGALHAAKEGWLHRSAVGLDMFINCLLPGGRPDETLSSRCALAAQNGSRWGKIGLWLLDHTLGHFHGPGAELADLGRAEIAEQAEEALDRGKAKKTARKAAK